MKLHHNYRNSTGFTLIELSIVLVIIGFIVGGVLVGRDLITAATERSQITQIEKYNQAINTFIGKYGSLPGDICDPDATKFGFVARGASLGQGDCNNSLEMSGGNPVNNQYGIMSGELALFWVDLSTAKLIEGNFNTATATGSITVPDTQFGLYWPSAKIGSKNYVHVYSGGWQAYSGSSTVRPDGYNYFSIAPISYISGGYIRAYTTSITVRQAYNIDKKIDDGLPQFGKVTAAFPASFIYWAAAGGDTGSGGAYNYGNRAPIQPSNANSITTAPSSSTCYDNASQPDAIEQYSITYQNGNNANCWLSFRFQ